jgi:hypothetical protein
MRKEWNEAFERLKKISAPYQSVLKAEQWDGMTSDQTESWHTLIFHKIRYCISTFAPDGMCSSSKWCDTPAEAVDAVEKLIKERNDAISKGCDN